MDFTWVYESNKINWSELSSLYQIASMGEKNPDDIAVAFSNSMYQCFVFKGTQLVGVGRALADGYDCSYICDIAVHPEYQGIGLGKRIVSQLVAFSSKHRKIILFSNIGKEDFYKKFGFMRMTTAMAIFHDQNDALEAGLVTES